ncbi:MAG: hypothetical protein U9N52_14245 [Campylobacterota bacterium]|nr:hypothetical protein [Campylobacterota bacterium]
MKPILFLFFLSMILTCSAQETLNQNTLSKEHKTRSEKMQRLMHELDNVMYKQNRSELERDDERRRYLIRLSEKLELMSDKIKKIIQNRSDDDQKVFLAYTDTLGDQGKKIKVLANNYQFEEVEPVIQETLDLCKSCHDGFNVDNSVLSHYK